MKKRIQSGKIRFAIYLIPAVMLLIAPFYNGDYNYYSLLNVLVFLSSCFSIYNLAKTPKRFNNFSLYIWIIIAILFNPFITIHLNHDYWFPIYILSGLFYVYYLIKEKF